LLVAPTKTFSLKSMQIVKKVTTVQFILHLVSFHLVAGLHCVYFIKLAKFYYSVTYTQKITALKCSFRNPLYQHVSSRFSH